MIHDLHLKISQLTTNKFTDLDLRNGLKVEDRVEGKHVAVVDPGHDVFDRLLLEDEGPGHDVDLVLLKIGVGVCHL